MFHRVIQKITLAQFFLRHGVYVRSLETVQASDMFTKEHLWEFEFIY